MLRPYDRTVDIHTKVGRNEANTILWKYGYEGELVKVCCNSPPGPRLKKFGNGPRGTRNRPSCSLRGSLPF